jgi:hypothetical protein
MGSSALPRVCGLHHYVAAPRPIWTDATRGVQDGSRRAGSREERGEVSPLVGLLERVRVVRGVGGIDRGRALPRQQGGKRLTDERRVREARTGASRVREQSRIDGRADPRPCHASNDCARHGAG